MSQCSKPTVLVLAALLLAAATSCNRGPATVKQPSINASSAGKLAIEQYDTNGDGVISGDELEKAPALKAALKNLDMNNDGAVSADEVAARVNAWKSMQTGLAACRMLVSLDGQPLVDADVTLEPEAFLGDDIKKAAAKSDQYGAAEPIMAPEDNPYAKIATGIQLGLYKVRVSKKVNGKETIPARYNSETMLGQEVSFDDPGMKRMKIVFALKSKP